MSHPNAFLGPVGRVELAKCIVEQGWPLRRAAERFQVSVPTAVRWARRYRELLDAGMKEIKGMEDRNSRPRLSPRRTPQRTERRIIALRVNRRWGPARIAYLLGMHPSTVHKVLSRYRLAKLTWLDRATGKVIRRYERKTPGELIHIDIKKLGRIPDGGGHRAVGRAQGWTNRGHSTKQPKPGYAFIHTAIDDYSRFAYSEILTDERQDTAAGFWQRANAAFRDSGITVQRILTDNGSCYRSKVFNHALGPDIKHKFTRPYRPQTNGKVERFNRTMVEEWAYIRPYRSETERTQAFQAWLHHYNHDRGHTALKGQPPATRVTNLNG